jgi:hypothetical protein
MKHLGNTGHADATDANEMNGAKLAWKLHESISNLGRRFS